jgi:excisionase family DNA binding protein
MRAEDKMDISNAPPFPKPVSVTVPTALALTGIGRTKFYELIKSGEIKTITIGRRRLVVYASLEALVK